MHIYIYIYTYTHNTPNTYMWSWLFAAPNRRGASLTGVAQGVWKRRGASEGVCTYTCQLSISSPSLLLSSPPLSSQRIVLTALLV